MPVVLLCHCDGTNGSTAFTDAYAHTLTATSATVSTTLPKFGTGSASFAATNAASITVGGSAADFNLGSGQFTVEAWAYVTGSLGGLQAVVTQFPSGSSNFGWWFGLNTNLLDFIYSTTGADFPIISGSFTPTANTWYHLAADRDASNVLRIYVNGAVLASGTVSAAFFASTQACIIGNDGNANRGFPGRLDEVRVITGTAQYGGAFTAPTAPFADPPILTTHRYWRLNMTANSGGGAYAFSETQFRVTAGVSLAFSGGTPSAADVFGGTPGANDASKAADGNISTLYSSNNKTAPQWWMYDFGATSTNWRNVVEVSITARNDANYNQAPQTFDVQWSDNNSTWTTQASCLVSTWTSAAQVQTVSALASTGVAPILDGSAHQLGNATTNTVVLTTTLTNNIICVLAYSEAFGATKRSVTSVVGGGLTWARRAQSNLGSAGISDFELWWALAPTALSAVGITVTFSGTCDASQVVAFGVNGCNTTSPWDQNSSLPSVRSNDTAGGFTGISTTNANDFLIFAMGSAWIQSVPSSSPVGFTFIIGGTGGPSVLYGTAEVWYRGVTTPQVNQAYSLVSPPWAANGNGQEAIFDALTADASGGGGGGAAQARAMVLA